MLTLYILGYVILGLLVGRKVAHIAIPYSEKHWGSIYSHQNRIYWPGVFWVSGLAFLFWPAFAGAAFFLWRRPSTPSEINAMSARIRALEIEAGIR